jgi:hypothetical protein
MNLNKDEEGLAFSLHKRLFLPYGTIFEVNLKKSVMKHPCYPMYKHISKKCKSMGVPSYLINQILL